MTVTVKEQSVICPLGVMARQVLVVAPAGYEEPLAKRAHAVVRGGGVGVEHDRCAGVAAAVHRHRGRAVDDRRLVVRHRYRIGVCVLGRGSTSSSISFLRNLKK